MRCRQVRVGQGMAAKSGRAVWVRSSGVGGGPCRASLLPVTEMKGDLSPRRDSCGQGWRPGRHGCHFVSFSSPPARLRHVCATGPGWFFLSSLTRAACPATQFSLTRALPELATDPTSSGSVPPAPTPDLSHRPDARPLTLLPSLPPSSTPSPTRDSLPCSLVQ